MVEDERGVRAFIGQALRRFGYQVLEAEDAEAALALLQAPDRPIRPLLTDVVLPRMDGLELAEHVLRVRPGVCVLFMSGYSEQFTADGGVLEPGVHLLEKPFTAHTLLAKVRDVLGTASAQAFEPTTSLHA